MTQASIRSLLFSVGMGLAMTGLAASGLVLGGCSDERTEKLEAASTSLAKTSASVTQLKLNVNQTNTALKKIPASTDLHQDYAALKERIAAVKANAVSIKALYEEMSTNKDAVVATWRQEIAEVQNPRLKASAAERSANLATALSEVTTNVAQAKEAYQPYVASLDELTKFLDKDHTPSGLKVAGPTIEESLKGGVEVMVQLQMLSSKLDTLSGEVSPTGK